MNKSNRYLEADEVRWLYEHGYTVRSSWISPEEGWEYRLSHIGEEKVIAFRTTMRGCYNAAKKHAFQQSRALDAAATTCHTPYACPNLVCPVCTVYENR